MALQPPGLLGIHTNMAATVPAGYRDWRLISMAHEEGSLNDIRAILGDDVAIPNPSFRGPLRTFSLWLRTRKSTPRRAAGDSLNLIRTANLPTRRHSKPAFPAT